MTAQRVVVEADGGSRGNPGPAGYGAVVLDPDTGEVLAEAKDYIGVETNNVAEYRGLIAGLSAARDLGARHVSVRMDSKLVVEQMNAKWRVRDAKLLPLAARARELLARIPKVRILHIPRDQNSIADLLANRAIDEAA